MRRGFTLVELSIVLVIIGLLIGGILVGQSMIGTAKVQSTIRMFGEFDAAVNNFQTKFNGVPGNLRSFGCLDDATTHTPCENGLIGVPNIPVSIALELTSIQEQNFWYNLQLTGFMPNTFFNSGWVSFSVNGVHPCTPKIPVGTNTGVIATAAGSDGMCQVAVGEGMNSTLCIPTGVTGNYYILGNWEGDELYNGGGLGGTTSTSSKGSITGADAEAIDAKMDDGNQDIGGRVSAYPDTNGFPGSGPYNLNQNYSLIVQFGTTTGGPVQ